MHPAPHTTPPRRCVSVADISAQSARDAEAERAARAWLAAKEHIMDTGIALAPLCGHRELESGARDFIESSAVGEHGAHEAYASGTRIEYPGARILSAASRPTLRAAGCCVTFADGGRFVSTADGASTYYAPSGRVRTVGAPRAAPSAFSRAKSTRVKVSAAARLFESAEPVRRSDLARQREAALRGRCAPSGRDRPSPLRTLTRVEDLRDAERADASPKVSAAEKRAGLLKLFASASSEARAFASARDPRCAKL